MFTLQPGILALGTRAHHHLHFDFLPRAPRHAVAAALAGLREPAVTMGGANLVLGFGASAWSALQPGRSPADLASFSPVAGPVATMPAAQHDLWVWIHGSATDVVLETARAVAAALGAIAMLADEQPGFVHRDSRDLSGFIDGTENPPVVEVPHLIAVPAGPGAGGTHVLVQRWVHDLDALHVRDLEAQEGVIGRTKAESIELSDERISASAHIVRAVIQGPGGEELEIFRRSTAFGDVRRHGLYFIGFSPDRARLDRMCARMVGLEDGVGDALFTFTRPVDGAVYFAPALEDLLALD